MAAAEPFRRATLRPWPAALGAAIALAVPVSAQHPEIRGILRDESGSWVAGATVVFRPDPAPDLPALRDLQQPQPNAVATSDARGEFRVASARPGLLLVTTASGLGAVVERAWPGRAVRVLLRPMAELKRADGAPFELHAAIRERDGSRRHLPKGQGTSVRLPAERYEVWTRSEDGATWQQLSLLPGEAHVLDVPQSATELHVPAGTTVSPAGFPQLELCGAVGPRCTLRGVAARAQLFATRDGRGCRCSGAADALLQATVAPSPTLTLRIDGAEVADVHLVACSERGEVAVLASTRSDGGRATLPLVDVGGERWIVATAPGRAAAAVPLPVAPRDGDVVLHLLQGSHLHCRVRGVDGQPVADVAITFASTDYGPTTAVAYADELGGADLGPVAGAGFVRVDDPRYCSIATSVAADENAPVELQLDPGRSVRGVVALADGTPVHGAAVVLRDSFGRLRPVERAVPSSAKGEFAFDGLEDSATLVLFVSQQRDGRTWSARLRVRSGDVDVRLVLHDEDPQIVPPRDNR